MKSKARTLAIIGSLGTGILSAAVAAEDKPDRIVLPPGRCVIVTAAAEDELVRAALTDAAQELRKHLACIVGTNVALAADGIVPPGHYPLYVGQVPAEDRDTLAGQETRWTITPAAAYLHGEGIRGTLYAVYGFLQDQLGIRWTAPGDDGIVCTPTNALVLRTGEYNWTPALRYRSIRLGDARKATSLGKLRGDMVRFAEFQSTLEAHNAFAESVWRWQLRMRMYGSRPGGGHAFSDWWGKYGATQPDYFALNKFGKREPVPMPKPDQTDAFVKICPSNPKVAEQLIANWLPLKERQQFISVGVNDGSGNFCECAACKALDAPQAGEAWDEHLTDRYVHMANAVAVEARKHRPDAFATMYAYLKTLAPPRRLRVESNIVVQLVPYVDPLDLGVVQRHFEGWRKAGATQLMLRPNYHPKYLTTALPLGIEQQMFAVFQLAWTNGCIATDYDSLVNNWPLTGITDYILARSMAEPDQPFERWAADYYAGFGAAAPEARAYFDYWRKEVWEARLQPNIIRICNRGGAGDFARGLMWSLGEYYRPEDFDKTDQILARAAARPLGAAEAKRLNQLRLANAHARLVVRATVADPQDKSTHAEALLAFRRKHKEDLPLRWIGVFARELGDGDLTGLLIADEMKDYLKPWLPTELFWKFQIDPQDAGLAAKWQERPWQAMVGWPEFRTDRFIEGQFEFDEPNNLPKELAEVILNYDGISWYATQIAIPADWRTRQVFLRFGAVDESCRVFVNGKPAGEHIYKETNDWKTPFEIRIDNVADWSREQQTITVRVQDTAGMGGVWRRVWLVSKAAEANAGGTASVGQPPAK